MDPADSIDSPLEMVERLVATTNAHDLDGLVNCFAADYRNETPAHPTRGFTGREQVRGNWKQIFAAVPDLHATVLRSAVAGDTVWTEWEMTGTRRDGTAHLMRGVILFGVIAGRATWARFYLETVQSAGGTIDSAVAAQLSGAQ
jgi:ketosteroid isomerase-like protein